jgi:NAD(P)H dehydrogenase (quinone)
MTIAVTGATGQLGRLVLEELLSSQEPGSLVAVVRDAGKAAEPQAKSAWDHVRDGAVSFGHSVKTFFTTLAGK